MILDKGLKLSSFFCLLMTVIMLAFTGQQVLAATTQCTVYSGSNVSGQNYTVRAATVKSALVQTGSNELMRFQANALSDAYLIEYYDLNYNLTNTVTVSQELSVYGGFYYDGTYYYILSGQNNSEEDNSTEVYRLTKYNSSWQRLGAASLYGVNTIAPFSAGSARMYHEGSTLFVRTCHTMYKSNDGYNHQANVTIQINTDTMSVLDSYTGVMNVNYGYVSHSFNQYTRLDNGYIVGVDHGDAHPRAVVLTKSRKPYTSTGYTKSFANAQLLAISGTTGANATGVSVGGFEISSDHYLVAGNSVEMSDSYSASDTRNIFISSVDRSLSETPVLHWITSYASGETSPETPQFMKIDDEHFLLLWMKDSVLNYCMINNNGEMTGSICTMNASLSDCVPIVIGQKVVWYTWKNGDVIFYEINTSDIATGNIVEIHNGHKYEYTYATAENNTASRECTVCHDKAEFSTLTGFSLWWWSGYSGSSAITSQPAIDSTYHVTLRNYSPSDAENQELELTSSDESIASIDGTYFTFLKHGIVTITISAKYNPEVKLQKTFIACHSIESSSVTKTSTCSEPGIKEYVCSCGEVIQENLALAPNNHAYDTYLANALEPTCVESGYTGDTYCSGCNQKLRSGTTSKPTGQHLYSEWTVTRTATCSASGEKQRTCTTCGTAETAVIAKDSANHSGAQVVRDSREATCGIGGYTGDTYCSDCNTKLQTGSVIPATGLHTWNEGEITTPATCIAQGSKTYTCIACTASYAETLLIDSNHHTGNTEVLNRSDAACGESGYSGDLYCSDCHALLEEGSMVDELQHVWNSGEITTPAGCETEGVRTYTCTLCREQRTESISAVGHDYQMAIIPADCTEEGYTLYTCSRCQDNYKDDSTEPLGHIPMTVTTPAAPGRDGIVESVCSRCSEKIETLASIAAPKKVTLSATSCTYSGKAIKPRVTVKNTKGDVINTSNYTLTYKNNVKVGKATVTVNFTTELYTGSLKATFKIDPKGTAISSLKAKSKSFVVKWKKQATQTTGYQIQYATSSKMSKAKTITISKTGTVSKSISKLKAKKKYYVRIRTYKTVSGTRYYSTWSSIKYVTTK